MLRYALDAQDLDVGKHGCLEMTRRSKVRSQVEYKFISIHVFVF